MARKRAAKLVEKLPTLPGPVVAQWVEGINACLSVRVQKDRLTLEGQQRQLEGKKLTDKDFTDVEYIGKVSMYKVNSDGSLGKRKTDTELKAELIAAVIQNRVDHRTMTTPVQQMSMSIDFSDVTLD